MNINLNRFIFVSKDDKFNCYLLIYNDKVNNENNNLYVLLIFLLIFNIKKYIYIEKYVFVCFNDCIVKYNNLFDNNFFMFLGVMKFLCVFFILVVFVVGMFI